MLFLLELLYFKIADRYNIIDKPNERSSHSTITIRGGGIIFSLAIVCWFLGFDMQLPYFVASVALIAAISFLDDIVTLKPLPRLVLHLISVTLLFYGAELFLYNPPSAPAMTINLLPTTLTATSASGNTVNLSL